VSPVRYEVGFYISEDGILHSDRRESLRAYIQFSSSVAGMPESSRSVARGENKTNKRQTYSW
jgi:hypothetical protein